MNMIVVRSCLFCCVLLLLSAIINTDFDSFPNGSTGSLRNDDKDALVLYGMPVKLSPESLSDMCEG